MAPVTHCVDDVRNDVRSDIKVQHKVLVIEEKATKVTTKGAGIICEFPIQPKSGKPHKEIRQFECEFPTVDANVSRVREALPFPNNLRDVIAWTDVFVDRIAQMSAAKEKEYAQLKKVNDNQLSKLELLAVGLREALEACDAQKDRADKVEGKLRREEANCEGLHQIINDLHSKHAREKIEHNEEIFGLTGKLSGALNDIKVLEARLSKEKKAHAATKQKFDAENEKDDAEIEKLKKENEKDDAEIAKLKKENEKDDAEIAQLKERIKNKTHEHSELKKKFTATEKDLNQTKHALTELKDALEKAQNDFKIEQGKKNALQKLLVKEVSDHNQTNAKLQAARDEVSRLEKELLAASTALAKVEVDLKSAQEESAKKIVDLQTKLDSSEQEAKTKLEAKITELGNVTNDFAKAKGEVERLNKESGDRFAKITCLEKDLKEVREGLRSSKTLYTNLLKEHTACVSWKNNPETLRLQGMIKDKDAAITAKDAIIETRDATIDELRATLMQERLHNQEIDEADLDHCHGDHDPKPAPAVSDDFKVKFEETDAKLQQAKADLQKTKEQLTDTRKRLIPTKEGYPITLISVEYGDREYTEDKYPEVLKKLYKIAASDKPSFKVTNDFFEGDPWWLHKKSCSIDYVINATGALMHAHAKEKDVLTFTFGKK